MSSLEVLVYLLQRSLLLIIFTIIAKSIFKIPVSNKILFSLEFLSYIALLSGLGLISSIVDLSIIEHILGIFIVYCFNKWFLSPILRKYDWFSMDDKRGMLKDKDN